MTKQEKLESLERLRAEQIEECRITASLAFELGHADLYREAKRILNELDRLRFRPITGDPNAEYLDSEDGTAVALRLPFA